MNIKVLIYAIILTILIDSIYLHFSLPWYKVKFDGLMGNIKLIPGIITWCLIAFSIAYFVLNKEYYAWTDVAVDGALMGVTLYGLYNLTNFATIDKWGIDLVFWDTLWGGILVSIVSTIIYFMKQSSIF